MEEKGLNANEIYSFIKYNKFPAGFTYSMLKLIGYNKYGNNSARAFNSLIKGRYLKMKLMEKETGNKEARYYWYDLNE